MMAFKGSIICSAWKEKIRGLSWWNLSSSFFFFFFKKEIGSLSCDTEHYQWKMA